MKKLIKRKKRTCWNKFLEKQKDRHPWEVVRIAKDSFGVRTSMGDIADKDGIPLNTQQEIVDAFQKHHLNSTGPDHQAHPQSPPTVTSPIPCKQASDQAIKEVHDAPSKTANSSSPGPDRVNYHLIKLIKDTPLGKAINDTAHRCEGTATPDSWRDSQMVIPKPNKAINLVKFWIPIVLANTVENWHRKLSPTAYNWHPLCSTTYNTAPARGGPQFAMMPTSSKAERAIAKGKRATLLGKGIMSAFNRVRKEKLVRLLTYNSLPSLAAYSRGFLAPQTFKMYWVGQERGIAQMAEGTPQGSPLSPVIWLIYLDDTLRKAQGRI